jgi:hypothetical protein
MLACLIEHHVGIPVPFTGIDWALCVDASVKHSSFSVVSSLRMYCGCFNQFQG